MQRIAYIVFDLSAFSIDEILIAVFCATAEYGDNRIQIDFKFQAAIGMHSF